ncbi:hypothetical protein CSHISOI_05760 [Colletotrichum shisoi]|uniref:Uncharacterized protein n=1 Tax=Colletotrichum shisoi TaxID=2078593 RepID=A0A5Q4BS13_9PEZI|nr:hypothetical protein CSHISOI_05760 [Colletotrichum shisoi]
MTRHRCLALHLAAALALLAAVVPGARVAAVEDLEAEDVPPECAAACTPIVQLTGRCEAQTEQRFGTDRRRAAVGGPEREARRRRKKKRSRQRTLGTRLGRRQREEEEEEEEDDDDVEDGDEEDESDDEEEEGAAARMQPAPGRLAETERSKAADKAGPDAAMRACVCGERGFDVAGAALGCAACVARNGTAVEANEDIRQIIAECGFVAAPAPPVLVTTTTPPPPATQTPSVPTTRSQPAEASPTQSADSVTPVTVFETPTFVTLPSIVPPNDAPASPPDLGDGNQMSNDARGVGVLGRGAVLAAIGVFLLS